MDHRPPRSRVLSLDEKGTLTVKAYAGRRWWPKKAKPPRIPAKQTIGGKTELLGSYDVHNGRLWLRFFKRKGAREVIRTLEFLRKRHRGYHLFILLDCWRAHRSKALKAFLRGKPITLVELPTNCSWLNPIERVFAEIQNQVLANSDFHSVPALKHAIRLYVRSEYPKLQTC